MKNTTTGFHDENVGFFLPFIIKAYHAIYYCTLVQTYNDTVGRVVTTDSCPTIIMSCSHVIVIVDLVRPSPTSKVSGGASRNLQLAVLSGLHLMIYKGNW